MIRKHFSISALAFALLAPARFSGAQVTDPPTATPAATTPEHDLLPTPITIHVKDMPFIEFVQQIAPQAKLKTLAQLDVGAPTVTIDADAKPFWSVLVDACTQAHRSIGWTYSARSAARSLSLNTQPMGLAIVNGPVLAQFNSIEHWQQMGEAPESRDHCEIKVQLFWEPRLDVMFFDTIGVPSEAVDEAGHSLLPTTPPGNSSRDDFGPYGSFQSMQQPQRRMNDTLHTIHLQPPAQVGRKIAHLVGDIRLFTAGEQKSTKIEDLQGIGKSKASYKFLKDSTLKVSSASVRDSEVVIQFECTKNAGESEDAWHQRAMLLTASEYQLFTPEGDAWSSAQNKVNLGWSDKAVYLVINAARLPNVSDPPKTLVLRAPEDAKEFDVHYDLKDLPLP